MTTSPTNTAIIDNDDGVRSLASPLVIVLGILLAAQILAAIVIGMGGGDLAPAQSQGPLLAFDRDQVVRILIEAPEGEPLALEKADDAWRLPGRGDFPAADFKVTELLEKLAKIEKRLPVATSESAAARFKVAEGDFERRLTLEAEGGPVAVVYLGDSPGFRRLFVRADAEPAVYEAELALFDASEKADDWTDKTYLRLEADDIQAVQLPDASLERKDDTWALVDASPDEELDQESVEDALRKISAPDFREVSVASSQADGPRGEPDLIIGVKMTSGETRQLRLYKAAEGESPILEVADEPYRFALSEYAAEGLTGLNRASLLVVKEDAADQAGEPSSEALSDPEVNGEETPETDEALPDSDGEEGEPPAADEASLDTEAPGPTDN